MTDQPNILLISTDHFRGDCPGRLGHPVAETRPGALTIALGPPRAPPRGLRGRPR